MRTLYTQAFKRLVKSIVVCGVLWQPAKADLRAISTTNDIEGSTIEFRSPEGYSCRFQDNEKPSLSIGAGIAEGAVIPGSSNNYSHYPGRTADPQPVVGVVLRVPLGGAPHNCDKVIKLETATMRVRKAQELYELGLISLDQLQAVSDSAYRIINDDT